MSASRERAKRTWLKTIDRCGGAEVPRSAWTLVEELVLEGKVSRLGPPRGPGSDWRRATPKEEEVKVHVIMGNDYPSHVFREEADADGFVEARTKEEKKMEALPPARRPRGRIYWKKYTFTLE